MKDVEQATIVKGYAVAAATVSTPAWVHALTDFGQMIVVMLGILIGVTTLYLNIQKIRKKK